jgi:starvation-inducible DNA-binding protein
LLLVKTHVYHWNVVGPLFLSIHELTEDHYENLFKATDELAERIRALGHLTPFSFGDMADSAKLNEETSSLSAEDMVGQLASDHEAIVRRIRPIAEKAEECGDFVTHDMLTARMTFHEKAVWMLRAMLS